ncbi:hypothetical protein HBB16_11330 [Pseudonocardia sp. MCCB 268]|nr:hypothetical protein [Pseudonocardia cytotoxica]
MSTNGSVCWRHDGRRPVAAGNAGPSTSCPAGGCARRVYGRQDPVSGSGTPSSRSSSRAAPGRRVRRPRGRASANAVDEQRSPHERDTGPTAQPIPGDSRRRRDHAEPTPGTWTCVRPFLQEDEPAPSGSGGAGLAVRRTSALPGPL